MAVNSSGDTMYATTIGLGQNATVYKSTNSGVDWTSIYDAGTGSYLGPTYCNSSGDVVAVANLYTNNNIRVSID